MNLIYHLVHKDLKKKSFPCLCSGADSDWHRLEYVTSRKGDAQRVEGGVKSCHGTPISHLPNLPVVQKNNKYLRVQSMPVFIPTCYLRIN